MTVRRLICRRIADGVHDSLFAGRVTVENHLITQVEKGEFAPENTFDQVLEENFILAPAFIDAHGHSDISLFAMPDATGKCAQGIAAEISGNCGLSPFPLTDRNRAHLQELYRQYQTDLTWSDFNSYMESLLNRRAQLELYPLVGHNTLRAAVAGYERKNLTSDELSVMQQMLDRELQSGALGLSLGLLYVPGCFSSFEEITALLQVVARHNKICTVHLKSEGNDLENALTDTLAAARAAGLRKLHLSHLKTAGSGNFHKLPLLLDALATPDLRVTGDCYCYDASMTQLSVILPQPFDQYDDVTLCDRLHDEKCFAAALNKLRAERTGDYFSRVRIISAAGQFRDCRGKLLSDCAVQYNVPAAELCLQIIRAGAAEATAAFHTLSRTNMEIIAAHPATVPGSDESTRDLSGKFGSSHPRGFGNHAEYFNLRRQQGIEIGAIIREMSAQVADIFGLTHIGRIAVNCRAVLVKLDPDQYCACNSFVNPHIPAAGAQIIRL